jgi:exoribonuclease-2
MGDIMPDTINDTQQRSILRRIARRAMLERGLLPEFSLHARAELDAISGSATGADKSTRDLRNLIWCSIDNDDSRDLDQLTVAEAMPGGAVKTLVAIADVDAVVKKQSALDDHARQNTTSVYTAAEIFPMLPEKLSTDLTSLNYESDRLAIVIEMVIAEDGSSAQVIVKREKLPQRKIKRSRSYRTNKFAPNLLVLTKYAKRATM